MCQDNSVASLLPLHPYRDGSESSYHIVMVLCPLNPYLDGSESFLSCVVAVDRTHSVIRVDFHSYVLLK